MVIRFPLRFSRSIILSLLILLFVLMAGATVLFYRSMGNVVRRERNQAAAEKTVEFKRNPIFLQRMPGYELLASVSDINDLCVYQGIYFAATNRGLILFDATGNAQAQYTTLDGLPVNYLQALAIYRDQLLIGTRGAGILIFNGRQFSHLQFKNKRYAHITALHATPQGTLFIGTQSSGVLTYDGSTVEKFHPAILGKQHITFFSGDSNNLEIATYHDGLYIWSEGVLKHYDKAQGLADSQVTSLLRTGEEIYAGTPSGITQITPGSIKGRMLADAFVTSILPTGDALLVGTFDQGVIRVSTRMSTPRRRRVSPTSSSDAAPFSSVRRLIPLGDFFVALTDQGIYRGEPGLGGDIHWQRFDHRDSAHSLNDVNIASLAIDRAGRLWVGYFDKGLDVLDQSGKLVARYLDETLYCINHISADTATGVVRVATSNGLVIFDEQGPPKIWREKDGLISNHVAHVLPVRLPGTEWSVSTAAGISLVEKTAIKSLYAFHGLVNNHVYTAATLGDKVYFGTLGGISVVQGTTVIENLTTANSGLRHNWVNALLTVNGVIFVGTYGGGVQALHSNRTWENFSDPIDRFEVNPNAMYFDGQNVFCGTLDRGLYVYHLATRRWEPLVKGLPSSNVTAIAADAHHLFVGTDNGLLKIRR